jgi:hypothetical protein
MVPFDFATFLWLCAPRPVETCSLCQGIGFGGQSFCKASIREQLDLDVQLLQKIVTLGTGVLANQQSADSELDHGESDCRRTD